MPKKASDYAKETCYTSPSGKLQHKNPNCRFLKGREVTKTNRRDAYLNSVSNICVTCWWDKDATNHINNIGKPLERKVFTLTFTGEELRQIYNLIGNVTTHPNFPEREKEFCEKLMETIRVVERDQAT